MVKMFAVLIVSILLAAGLAPAQMKDHDMGGKKKDKMHDMSAMHHAAGTVKAVDAQGGKVTLAHGAVKTLDWPAMTMSFAVRDPALLAKLAVNKKVEVEFMQDGKDYVITAVK